MAFFNAGTGGSVYVVRLRHMHLLRMEDQGINIKHTPARTRTHTPPPPPSPLFTISYAKSQSVFVIWMNQPPKKGFQISSIQFIFIKF